MIQPESVVEDDATGARYNSINKEIKIHKMWEVYKFFVKLCGDIASSKNKRNQGFLYSLCWKYWNCNRLPFFCFCIDSLFLLSVLPDPQHNLLLLVRQLLKNRAKYAQLCPATVHTARKICPIVSRYRTHYWKNLPNCIPLQYTLLEKSAQLYPATVHTTGKICPIVFRYSTHC